MRSSSRLSLMGLLAGAALAAGLAAPDALMQQRSRTRRSNTSPNTRTQQRYRGMTDEQRAWNAAIDAKRAAKGRS